MHKSKPHYLVSADPGSAKAWTVASCHLKVHPEIRIKPRKIEELEKLAEELCEEAKKGHVTLSLDAPVQVFGELQRPASLAPSVMSKLETHWPFNVNPFSQRPCEKALTSRPKVRNDSLVHKALAQALATLCCWGDEYTADGNESFTLRHDGTSVRNYMGAPHGPVVGTFLDILKEKARQNGVSLSYDPTSINDGERVISVLETHPAVALAFYASYQLGRFPKIIQKYKPLNTSTQPVFGDLKDAVLEYANRERGVVEALDIKCDDDLDAVVGLFNILDLANGDGDIFGTVETGYFLVPSSPKGTSFKKLWQDAEDGQRRGRPNR
jgi:hypothetical protein